MPESESFEERVEAICEAGNEAIDTALPSARNMQRYADYVNAVKKTVGETRAKKEADEHFTGNAKTDLAHFVGQALEKNWAGVNRIIAQIKQREETDPVSSYLIRKGLDAVRSQLEVPDVLWPKFSDTGRDRR